MMMILRLREYENKRYDMMKKGEEMYDEIDDDDNE